MSRLVFEITLKNVFKVFTVIIVFFALLKFVRVRSTFSKTKQKYGYSPKRALGTYTQVDGAQSIQHFNTRDGPTDVIQCTRCRTVENTRAACAVKRQYYKHTQCRTILCESCDDKRKIMRKTTAVLLLSRIMYNVFCVAVSLSSETENDFDRLRTPIAKHKSSRDVFNEPLYCCLLTAFFFCFFYFAITNRYLSTSVCGKIRT